MLPPQLTHLKAPRVCRLFMFHYRACGTKPKTTFWPLSVHFCIWTQHVAALGAWTQSVASLTIMLADSLCANVAGWPEDGTVKPTKCSKWIGLVLLRAWMCSQNFRGICQLDFNISTYFLCVRVWSWCDMKERTGVHQKHQELQFVTGVPWVEISCSKSVWQIGQWWY